MKSRRIFFFVLTPLVFIGLISMTGCMTASGKNYYQVYVPYAGGNAGAEDTGAAIKNVLLVQTVKVDEIYNDYRIVYRESPYRLNYYSYHFWIKTPGIMIRESIVDYLTKRKYFSGVIGELAEGEPGLVLNTTVQVLEEYDNTGFWSAHLKMRFEVTRFKTKEFVAVYNFDRMKRLPDKKVSHLAESISQILKEELEILLTKIELQNF